MTNSILHSAPDDTDFEESTRESAGSHDQLDRSHRFVALHNSLEMGTQLPLPADRGAEFVPAREWMRICFELLDLLKAHKKAIRRAAVNSFGYIAKSLGPQDVLQVLLTNLRVQERQSRVCSTVAIGIVAETCGRE